MIHSKNLRQGQDLPQTGIHLPERNLCGFTHNLHLCRQLLTLDQTHHEAALQLSSQAPHRSPLGGSSSSLLWCISSSRSISKSSSVKINLLNFSLPPEFYQHVGQDN
ncbi:hypothetical protein AMECASPLE_038575 [Ameca splendens]|uniref:Uncharacterized protein n=1 Tax=Ameca splendens TaxID=208324 RepID=A0ABV0YVB9_9TELE